MNKAFPLIAFLVCLAGCIGPKYQRPQHPLPDTFNNAACGTSEKEPLTQWWHQFHDPMLNRLINRAVDYNYNLRIAQEKIEESRALYQFKEAQLFPQIDGITTLRHTRFSQVLAQTSFLTDPNVSFFQLGTDAFWELDFWGRLRHERNAQFFAFQAQIEQMHDVLIILIAEVVRRYVDLCAFAQQITLTEQKIEVDTRLVTLQNDLYISGLASKIELVRQQQVLETTRNQLEQLKIELAQTNHQLAVLLGLNSEDLTITSLRKTVPLSTYRIATGMPSELLRRRPDIRQAERLIASANESVGAAIAEWFPRFTLFGGLTSESSKGKNWFEGKSISWFVGPSIRWPIINFGRIKANIHVQESVKRQAILSYSNTIINALKDVEDFLSAYCYTKEQLLITAAKYSQAVEQQRLTDVKFDAGLASELEYLNAQSNSITVAVEVTTTSQTLSNTLASLYKALGGGW